MLRLPLFALIGIVSVGTNANASTYHSRHYYHHRHHVGAAAGSYGAHPWRREAYSGGSIVAHPANCPATLFCGCGAAHELGLSDRSLWLVRSWYRFPRAAAAPGMAALWGSRHVAVIRAVNGDGTATVYDANSGGGLTRVHRVSLAGLTIVNPHGGGSVPMANEPMPQHQRVAANRIAHRHQTLAWYATARSGYRQAHNLDPRDGTWAAAERIAYRHSTLARYAAARSGYRRARNLYPSEGTWSVARADMFVSFAR